MKGASSETKNAIATLEAVGERVERAAPRTSVTHSAAAAQEAVGDRGAGAMSFWVVGTQRATLQSLLAVLAGAMGSILGSMAAAGLAEREAAEMARLKETPAGNWVANPLCQPRCSARISLPRQHGNTGMVRLRLRALPRRRSDAGQAGESRTHLPAATAQLSR